MSEPRYHAHTAEAPDGTRLPESSGLWQLLSTHLRNVAALAKQFAAPLGLSAEAELAGLLHDLGKYAKRFQARLRDNSIHGVNHWAAGAAQAAELRLHASAFAVDGHHTGMPARDGNGLKQTIAQMRLDAERENFCKCVESLPELLRRFAADGLHLRKFRNELGVIRSLKPSVPVCFSPASWMPTSATRKATTIRAPQVFDRFLNFSQSAPWKSSNVILLACPLTAM